MSFSLKTLKIVGAAAVASLSFAGMNTAAQADAQLSGQLSIGIQGSNAEENAVNPTILSPTSGTLTSTSHASWK